MRAKSLDDHLKGAGPKRVLSLDGGGVRGVVAIAFLERIESVLRDRFEDDLKARFGAEYEFRLCDYFDMIGGTSTGAIIAAGVATGRTVADLKQLYFSLAKKIFKKPGLLGFTRIGIVRPKFDHDTLRDILRQEFDGITMESDEIKTGLAIFMKNATTNSPWIITNTPDRKHWKGAVLGEGTIPMNHYKLFEAVSGSTAAPYYFHPQNIQISEGGEENAFVDGGLTPFNNPTLGLLDLVTLNAYGINWTKGIDQLLMISIGTGQFGHVRKEPRWWENASAIAAINNLRGLIEDIELLTLRRSMLLANCHTRWDLDRDLEDLATEPQGQDMTMARYNIVLGPTWIAKNTSSTLSNEEVWALFDMTNVGGMETCYAIAQEVAEHQVKPNHFDDVFNL
ncbi:MAG: patatin-like phospholipase family protein [Alphaproteobacteria bacterium]